MTSRALAHALERSDRGVRKAYERLSTEDKESLNEAYWRHYLACKKSDIPTDDLWLRDFIGDLKFGPIEELSVNAN